MNRNEFNNWYETHKAELIRLTMQPKRVITLHDWDRVKFTFNPPNCVGEIGFLPEVNVLQDAMERLKYERELLYRLTMIPKEYFSQEINSSQNVSYWQHFEPIIHNGMNCQVSPLLPMDETVSACDIETRQEIKVLTGEKINCVRVGGTLLMTKELYDTIKSNYLPCEDID